MRTTRGERAKADDSIEVVQGVRAGLAVFGRRPEDIKRVMHGRTIRRDIDALVRWASSHDVPCREAEEHELNRFAGSTHHEGLCLACRPRRWAAVQDVADALTRSKGVAVALDRVRNPYNVGAILRTAAFFGVDAALLGALAPDPGLQALSVRVAEGGAEQLLLSRTTDLAGSLGKLRARGVMVVGADAAAQVSVFDFSWPRRPVVLVVGHEREGLGDRMRAQCDSIVAIPGAGKIESLNVSVAAGVMIAEMLAHP